jgi:hypothetical protein
VAKDVMVWVVFIVGLRVFVPLLYSYFAANGRWKQKGKGRERENTD